jgi:hypothetical protein
MLDWTITLLIIAIIARVLGNYPLIHKKTRCHPELVEG